ncbi:MAG: hypothetical protein U0M06_08695, partial [Clostridia bacterium]|nr:hypothetical protein [Clostridia bacterium]
FKSSYDWENGLRTVTVTAINLISADEPVQTDLFGSTRDIEKAEKIENCASEIRDRFGEKAILPASLLQGRKQHFFEHKGKNIEPKPFKRG